jgi:hypothetical protein
MHNKNHGHSFTIKAHTPFGGDDFLLLIDDIAKEAEISTQRGSVKIQKYVVSEDSFSAEFDVNTPMDASVRIGFSKLVGDDYYSGKIHIGEYLSVPIIARRHL